MLDLVRTLPSLRPSILCFQSVDGIRTNVAVPAGTPRLRQEAVHCLKLLPAEDERPYVTREGVGCLT